MNTLHIPGEADPLETKELEGLVGPPLPGGAVGQRNHCLYNVILKTYHISDLSQTLKRRKKNKN